MKLKRQIEEHRERIYAKLIAYVSLSQPTMEFSDEWVKEVKAMVDSLCNLCICLGAESVERDIAIEKVADECGLGVVK